MGGPRLEGFGRQEEDPAGILWGLSWPHSILRASRPLSRAVAAVLTAQPGGPLVALLLPYIPSRLVTEVRAPVLGEVSPSGWDCTAPMWPTGLRDQAAMAHPGESLPSCSLLSNGAQDGPPTLKATCLSCLPRGQPRPHPPHPYLPLNVPSLAKTLDSTDGVQRLHRTPERICMAHLYLYHTPVSVPHT